MRVDAGSAGVLARWFLRDKLLLQIHADADVDVRDPS
jgi:hypothetical protein